MSITKAQYEYYMAHRSDDRRPNEIAAGVCGLTLALMALGGRITSRLVSRAKFGLDDLFCCLGMVGVLGYAITLFISVENGEGLHIIFVKSEKRFIQGMVVAIVCYAWAVMFTKYSILLYYRRIFKAKWLFWASDIIGLIVVAYNLAVLFVAGFECVPLSSLWTGESATCINTKPPYTGLAIVNVITDVAILALPAVPVFNLNMKLKRKIQVLGIFLTGGVVCVFGIIRCVAIANMGSVDPSWTDCFSGIWSFVEISVGIVAACLPTMGPLFKENSFNFRSYGSRIGLFSSKRPFFSSARYSAESGSAELSHTKLAQLSQRDSQQERVVTSNAYYNTTEFEPIATRDPKRPPMTNQSQIFIQNKIEQSRENVV